jgi:L-glyceraldehyde 3-phosphate reductase
MLAATPPHRDELVISTKAGYDMWPGPYGEWGSRKYLLASLDQSPGADGLDYVDIFYSTASTPRRRSRRRWARSTPPCARAGALRRHLVLQLGRTREAAAILRDLGTPLLIRSPRTRC